MVEFHFAVGGLCSVAVLQLQTIWPADLVCGDCALWPASRLFAYLPSFRKAARIASECGSAGLCGHTAEPLRSHRANPGFADFGFRRIPALHAELARGGQLRWRAGIWSHCLLLVVSLPAAVCTAKRRKHTCFRELMDFAGL